MVGAPGSKKSYGTLLQPPLVGVASLFSLRVVCLCCVCVAVYKEPYLLVYCESALEVYDVSNSKWVQIIPLRKVSQSVKPQTFPVWI